MGEIVAQVLNLYDPYEAKTQLICRLQVTRKMVKGFTMLSRLEGESKFLFPPSVRVDLAPVSSSAAQQVQGGPAAVPTRHNVTLHRDKVVTSPSIDNDGVHCSGRVDTLVFNANIAANQTTIRRKAATLRVLCNQKFTQATAVTIECSLGAAVLTGAGAGAVKGSPAAGPGAVVGALLGGLLGATTCIRRQSENSATLRALQNILQILDFFELVSNNQLDYHTIICHLDSLDSASKSMAASAQNALRELERVFEMSTDPNMCQLMKAYSLEKNAKAIKAARGEP